MSFYMKIKEVYKMGVEILALPLFAAVLGFVPIGLALMGKADLKTACKIGLMVGIVLLLSAIMIYGFGMDLQALGAADDATLMYMVAAILGVGSLAFLTLGLFGVTDIAYANLPTVASVILYVGLFFLIAGAYAATQLALVVTGVVIILLGIKAILGGLAGYGKIGAGSGQGIMLLVLVNTVLCLTILIGLAV